MNIPSKYLVYAIRCIGLIHRAAAPFAFHRAEFLDCLANNVDREATTLHFGKRLTNFVLPTEPTAPIILEFKDGSQSSCDVLIGADGIHSATRSTLLELAAQDSEACGSENGKKTANTLRDMKEPVWSGHTAYRTVANTEKLKKLNPKHRTLTTFQIVSLCHISLLSFYRFLNIHPTVLRKGKGMNYFQAQNRNSGDKLVAHRCISHRPWKIRQYCCVSFLARESRDQV